MADADPGFWRVEIEREGQRIRQFFPMSDDLFAPRVPEEVANRRPLADRLRPQTIAEVTGQEHLTGEDGVLRRMIASGSLGSMIFWGPPGTGKTTVARLLSR